MHKLGHHVLFLERDVPWYAGNRDTTEVPYADVELYGSLEELKDRFTDAVRNADLVIVGSFVPDGPAVIDWVLNTARNVRAFYDIDTPVTLAMMVSGDHRHLHPSLMPKFDLYFSFTGGPMLRRLENEYGVQSAKPLYCAVDESSYYPESVAKHWDLGYLGTFSPDRQPSLDRFLSEPAKRDSELRFVVAGSMFPADIAWHSNVEKIDHLSPDKHRRFYNEQRLTLNITRADMLKSGYSPSVRLFEAAACSTPIITDRWMGIEEFFTPGDDILVADTTEDVQKYLRDLTPDDLARLAENARSRVLRVHSSTVRAGELIDAFQQVADGQLARR